MLTHNYEDKNSHITAKHWSNVYPITHTHTFWEILFLCKGSLMNTLNKEQREMHKYDVALIQPTSIHKMKPLTDTKVEYYNITIEASFFEEFCNRIYEGLIDELSSATNLCITLSAHRHKKLMDLISFASSTTNKENAAKYYNIVLSYLLPEFIPFDETQTLSVVEKALKMMSNPSYMSLTIKDIAKDLGYTPEHLTRLFKKENAGSPSQVFLGLKMSHAKLLLMQTDLSVAEIAKTIGMESLPHFYRIFKKFFGTTPSAIRRGQK
jgi:AraC-like DNA-binding protein